MQIIIRDIVCIHVACKTSTEHTDHAFEFTSHNGMRFNLSARMSSRLLPLTGAVIGVASVRTGMGVFRDSVVVRLYDRYGDWKSRVSM